jgi:hypothetical protein
MNSAPLPPAVPLLAALGLALLALCTVPAVRSQQRLEREHARLQAETQNAEAELDRLHQELRNGTPERYVRIRATRDLLHHGATYIEERDRRLGRRKP